MMSDVDIAMDGMSGHCRDSSTAEMAAMHDDLDREWSLHLSAMDASIFLRREVDRHASWMRAILDSMDSAIGSMNCT